MEAVLTDASGSLRLGSATDATAKPDEVLVAVGAAGVNRADLLQAAGLYPPPKGASEILGLECSGTVVAGDGDAGVGEQVCALLSGGGYGSLVAVPAGQLMPVPEGVSPLAAAGLPEVACTVWSNLTMVAGLRAGERVLIHGGGSGIGTCAIQYAKAIGAEVFVTVGSDQKGVRCAELGADCIINYRESDFAEVIAEQTDGAGVDVILDIMGAKYLPGNVASLAVGGRLVVIGLQGGVRGELNLGRLLARRASITATSLRFRPAAAKAEICRGVVEQMWPLYAAGRMRPVIDTVLPFDRAQAAHELLRDGGAFGKVVLSGW